MEPHSIKVYKAREEELSKLAFHQKEYSLKSTQAAFFESAADRTSNPKQATADMATMTEDLRLAAEQLTRVRRERLREQYKAEMDHWQRELAKLGLTIDPDRR